MELKNLIRYDETDDMVMNKEKGDWVDYESAAELVEERDDRITELEEAIKGIASKIAEL